jgi:hypothetical protein
MLYCDLHLVYYKLYTAAINSTGRYYISLSTRLSERTTHIAYLSLFQTVGFILGPAIQVVILFHTSVDNLLKSYLYTAFRNRISLSLKYIPLYIHLLNFFRISAIVTQ